VPKGDERLGSFLFGGEAVVGLELRDDERLAAQAAAEDRLFPVEAGSLQLRGRDVIPKRRLFNKGRAAADEIEYFLVVEPLSRLQMNFQRRRREVDDVPAIFEGFNVEVQALPVVGDDRRLAAGLELVRYAEFFELPRSRIPRDGFLTISLA
jgi:hypothetical protein